MIVKRTNCLEQLYIEQSLYSTYAVVKIYARNEQLKYNYIATIA
jgi:hypothetical protein